MPTPPAILLLTDRPAISERIGAIASRAELPLRSFDAAAGLLEAVAPGVAILADLRLGGSVAPGAVAALRCDPRCLDLPILALVDDGDDATVRDALGAGADDFLRWSFLERELLFRLEARRRAWKVRDELRSRERDLRILVDLTRSFAGALDAETVLHDLTRRLAEVLGLGRCSVVLADPRSDSGLVVASSEESGGRSIDLARYPEIRQVLRTRKTLVVESPERHPILDPVRDVIPPEGIGSIAVLPLAFEEEALGVLFLRSPAEAPRRSFSARELDFATTVANATAVALRNARSVEAIRNRVEEAELRARELRRFEEIYDHVSDAIALIDGGSGAILSINPAGLELLGLPADQVRGRPIREVLQPEEEATHAELVRRAAGGETLQNLDLQARRRDGEILYLSVSATRLAPGVVLLSVRDVTERKRYQEELARARAFVERQQMVAELAGAAAHELNQPLTSVLGYAELLQRRVPAEDTAARPVGIILREAERMAEVVRKIGRITRHETKAYVGTKRIVDLEKSAPRDDTI